jgi:hypothetical protein
VATSDFGVDNPYAPELILVLGSGECAGGDCGTSQDPPSGAPSVFAEVFSVPARDGFTTELSEDAEIGGAANTLSGALLIGDDSRDRQYRGQLSFDTSFLDANDVILSVTLEMTRGGGRGNPLSIAAPLGSVLNVDMVCPDPGFIGPNDALTREDFESFTDLTGVTTLNVPAINATKATGTLPLSGILAINRDGETQFRISFPEGDNDNERADYVSFFPGEVSNDDFKPKLIIEYEDN